MMPVFACARFGLRRHRLGIGTSAAALVAAMSAPALAECSPPPSANRVTTLCTGVTLEGIRMAGNEVTIGVTPGASLFTGSAAAPIMVEGIAGLVAVAGTVDGGTKPGLLVTNARSFVNAIGSYTLVQAPGVLRGSVAVQLTKLAGNDAPLTFAVSNAGTITGTSGIAVDAGADTSLSSVSNGGMINGGIRSFVLSLDNSGTIDGGTRSALAEAPGFVEEVYSEDSRHELRNSGMIRSAGVEATLDLQPTKNGYLSRLNPSAPASETYGPPVRLANSGTIANAGSGAAITSPGGLTISNAAGGAITSAGGPAIRADAALTIINAGRIAATGVAVQANGRLALTNTGTVDGSIVAAGPAGTASRIDNRLGTITGDVLFGAGDDTFLGRLDAQGRLLGVTGRVDGGGGLDTFGVDVSGNLTLGAAGLPANFERLGLNLLGATVEVIADPGLPAGLLLSGTGSVAINADLTTSAPAISGETAVTNNRAIRATLPAADQSAVALGGGSFTNNGSVAATGGGGVTALTLTNAGTITASGTAATAATGIGGGGRGGVSFPLGGTITNSGTIRSTAGTGAQGAYNAGITNSGTIEGATYGIDGRGIRVVNTGTIAGATAGIVLRTGGGAVPSYDTDNAITNEAGGIIRGGISATSIANPTTGYPLGLGATIINRGTIEGSVTADSSAGGRTGSRITLDNVTGMITGDVLLAEGSDRFVTALPGANGRFRGIGGTVDAGGGIGIDTIVYEVRGTASAVIAPPPTFERVGYNVRDNAALTLTAPGTIAAAPLEIGGSGSVNLQADLASGTSPALSLRGEYDAAKATPLQVVYRGTITHVTDGGTQTAVSGSNVRFENAGTINVAPSPSASNAQLVAAIEVVGVAVNSGTINLSDGFGARGVFGGGGLSEFTNTGAIRQVGSGGTVRGVSLDGGGALTNRGTISVNNYAAYAANIINSGLLESTADVAVLFNTGRGAATLVNQAGGTIRGATAAISGSGSVVNQGTIIGNVAFGGGGTRFGPGGSSYVADGGTLTGNLTFGAGDDVFIQRGSVTGVSGTIDAGGGFDVYGRSFTSDATYAPGAALPATFEGELVEASGASTTVTLVNPAGSARDFYVIGDGRIVNRTALAGSVVGLDPTFYAQGVRLASFTNNAAIGGSVSGAFQTFTNEGATIGGGVRGTIRRFGNSGTITSLPGGRAAFVAAVQINAEGGFDFTNSGAILAKDGAFGVAAFANNGTSFTFQNSGRIEGPSYVAMNMAPDLRNGAFTATNSGTITTDLDQLSAFYATFYDQGGRALSQSGNTFTLTNSGTIHAGGLVGGGVVVSPIFSDPTFRTVINNSGTIESLGDGYLQQPGIYQGYFSPSAAILVNGTGENQLVTINNAAGGTIAIAGKAAVAIAAFNTPFVLNNAGTIRGNEGTAIPENTGSQYPVKDYFGGAVQSGGYADRIVNTGLIAGWMDLGGGDDVVENRGQITGDVFLRGGDDHWIQLAAATLIGTANGGEGIDTLTFDATQGGTVDPARIGRYTGFERFEQVGNGTVSYSGTIPFDTINVVGGTVTVSAGQNLATGGAVSVTGSAGGETVINNGRLAGGIDLRGGNDTVVVNGEVAGSIALGDGDDRLVLARPLLVTVDAGAGVNTLEYAGAATTPLTVQNLPGFQNLQVSSGFATQRGDERFSQVMVTGGQLTGMAGSTLTAPLIGVAPGATFGSAGIVNGSVAVGGTLSPGASPGTMTVNGNVALASGSISIFEITPALSDKLLVSGTVTIASGATLQLVAGDAVKPGTSLDLIVAGGGISGSFSTVTKPASLFGFIAQDATRIRLLGQFQNDTALPRNTRSAIDYVNATIGGGGASAGFLAALPQLVTAAGATDAAGFAWISPEAYASARQVAVENGLVLADALRGTAFAPHRATAGLFATGQILGNWRRLGGNVVAGVARASSDGWGALGGLGWSREDWSLGAFVGYLDSRQTLRGRGARTDADGVIGGVQAGYASAGLTLAASVSYAGGDADTRRSLPGNAFVTGRYSLNSWTGDVSARVAFALSPQLSLQPKLGATVVRSTRGTLVETGGSAFALTVRRDRDTALFLDGGAMLSTADEAAPVRFNASVGARWQVAGRNSIAIASLGGGGLGLAAEGVDRSRLLGVAALGLEGSVSPSVTLFASASGERSAHEHREAVRGGVRIGF